MKVGIITFHFPYNCGAVLQCFALQTVLESMVSSEPIYTAEKPGILGRKVFCQSGKDDRSSSVPRGGRIFKDGAFLEKLSGGIQKRKQIPSVCEKVSERDEGIPDIKRIAEEAACLRRVHSRQ